MNVCSAKSTEHTYRHYRSSAKWRARCASILHKPCEAGGSKAAWKAQYMAVHGTLLNITPVLGRDENKPRFANSQQALSDNVVRSFYDKLYNVLSIISILCLPSLSQLPRNKNKNLFLKCYYDLVIQNSFNEAWYLLVYQVYR